MPSNERLNKSISATYHWTKNIFVQLKKFKPEVVRNISKRYRVNTCVKPQLPTEKTAQDVLPYVSFTAIWNGVVRHTISTL